jgi:hypothetical protein
MTSAERPVRHGHSLSDTPYEEEDPMRRANVLRTAFGLAIAFGLIFDQPDLTDRAVADAAEAAALIEPAMEAGDGDGARLVETVAARARLCSAAHRTDADAAATQREL